MSIFSFKVIILFVYNYKSISESYVSKPVIKLPYKIIFIWGYN